MAQILVRGLKEQTVARLREQARENHRSLEAEVRLVLEEQAERGTRQDWIHALRRFRESLGDRVFEDSTQLIREDRER
jgi:plasmid stability protein